MKSKQILFFTMAVAALSFSSAWAENSSVGKTDLKLRTVVLDDRLIAISDSGRVYGVDCGFFKSNLVSTNSRGELNFEGYEASGGRSTNNDVAPYYELSRTAAASICPGAFSAPKAGEFVVSLQGNRAELISALGAKPVNSLATDLTSDLPAARTTEIGDAGLMGRKLVAVTEAGDVFGVDCGVTRSNLIAVNSRGELNFNGYQGSLGRTPNINKTQFYSLTENAATSLCHTSGEDEQYVISIEGNVADVVGAGIANSGQNGNPAL